MLAIPTVKGKKSPSERFAGADDTYTIEALMQNGWALQSGKKNHMIPNLFLYLLRIIASSFIIILPLCEKYDCIYFYCPSLSACSLLINSLFIFLFLHTGTSHFLGLNFARAFDVFFQTETGTFFLFYFMF